MGEAVRGTPQGGHLLSQALLNWRVLVIGLFYIGMNMGLSGINNWLPTIVKTFASLSNLEATSLTAIPWACAAVAAVLWGRHSDRRNERYVSLAIPLIIGAAGFAASAYTSSPLIGIVCLSVATMGIIAGYAVFWVIPGTFLSDMAAAGGIALINSMGNVGGFLAPFTIGWIKQETGCFTYALLVLSGGMAAAGLIALLIRPARPARSPREREGCYRRCRPGRRKRPVSNNESKEESMFHGYRRRAAVIAGAVALAAGPFAPVQAQTAAPAQYVVTYGELAPTAEAWLTGNLLLAELTRLAKNSGAQYFSVNTETNRPNHITLVEVWQDAAAYSAFTGASNVQQTFRYLQPLLLAPLDERDGNLVTASPTN